MHSIIRAEKHKSIGQLKTREAHTFRTRPTPNADPAKIKKNKLLFGLENYSSYAEERLDEYKNANSVRKDAVVAIEYLLTASPEFFDVGPKPERDKRLKTWCDAQVDFIKKQHGAENVLCMYLHLDEKTPHIEAYVLPIDPKGKLNCKHFLGGAKKLSDLQTAYADHNKGLGLSRGLGGSQATHTDIKKFYAMITDKAAITGQDVVTAAAIDSPLARDWLNLQDFLKEQQAKIVRNIIKLFQGTVYENKLLPEAKKILRDAKRRESEANRLKLKLEDQQETIVQQASDQKRLIERLEALETEKSGQDGAYRKLLAENNRLKTQYGLDAEKSRPT